MKKEGGFIRWKWVPRKRSNPLNPKERFINALLVVIRMDFIFHLNGIKRKTERFISSALTVTAVSESGGRLKIPLKRVKQMKQVRNPFPTGKGSLYRNLNSMMSVRTTLFIKSLKIELTHALGNLPPPLSVASRTDFA